MNSSTYHMINVFNEGRFVMSLDFDNKPEALREMVSLQEDGFGTELLTLSKANIFDSAPEQSDTELERFY